jgi:hypothetical protein
LAAVIDTQPSKWNLGDLGALIALDKLEGPFVPWTSWSMQPAAVASIVNAIWFDHPRSVVELGVGASSFYLGRVLRETGGKLVSIEENGPWAERIAAGLEGEGLAATAKVAHAPLVELPERPASFPAAAPPCWYDRAVLEDCLPAEIDILVVDGPAAGDRPETLVRFAAVPLLADRLADPFLIVLDDIDREAERETIGAWGTLLDREPLVIPRLGIGILQSSSRVFPAL